ncbi:MAG: carbon-nitrogen hydrolase family protein [Mesotoga sp.]|uniref:carbon-nitrogen hydrolase family protein n=1 Tax=Mesotoga sp. TaxID=2053577 RepID=UPI00260381F7|nr:carbon-nitrogen hydrolase family protein [Mesotoga sp.]MDD3681757.1 carbon-nitrogen hydrolase family protein [Mesotoga sp.]
MKEFVASAIQFEVEPMNIERNLEVAYQWISRCVKESAASLIVLPESFTTGFTPAGSACELWDVVDKIPGRLTNEGLKWASEFNIYICFPTYERGKERGIIYNSAAVLGPEGILGVYRKTHPFPTERLAAGGWTTPGVDPLVVSTPIAEIAVVICYDGDFPELARVTALKGAEVVCRPSAFLRTYDQWELTNRARAYDNHVYWIASNLVGKDASGANFFGSSMIVHPSGAKIVQASGCEEYISARLNNDPIKKIIPGSSRDQIFDHLEDRNLDSYKGILTEGKSAFEPSKRIPYGRR